MFDRIKAAVDARIDPDFVIMARTDALAVDGLQAAIDRAAACVEAGADMIFPEAMTELGMYRQFVDAVAPIGEPGRIHRFDLTDGPVPIAIAPRSTHAFGVAETVELARSLGRLPSDLVVYLVEGERFTTGAPLSPAVAKAVDEVAELIIAELPRISSDHEAATGAPSHA